MEILAGILNYGFGLAYTATNGLRDLLSEGRSGKYIWRFDGKVYKPHKGHPKTATQPREDMDKTSGPGSRIPGCVGAYGWRWGREAGSGGSRGYAVFGSCTDPMNMVLQLDCDAAKRGVSGRLEFGPGQPGKVAILFTVDGKRFERTAQAQFTELGGYHQPEFHLQRNDALLTSLARGRIATIQVEKRSVKIHLKGAGKAIGTMLGACGR